MNRIKALYRSWAIPCSGTTVYAPRHREEWLAKIVEPGVRVRAEHLYQQLDSLQPVRFEARRELLQESHEHAAVKLLRQIPSSAASDRPRDPYFAFPSGYRNKRILVAHLKFSDTTTDPFDISATASIAAAIKQFGNRRITAFKLVFDFILPFGANVALDLQSSCGCCD